MDYKTTIPEKLANALPPFAKIEKLINDVDKIASTIPNTRDAYILYNRMVYACKIIKRYKALYATKLTLYPTDKKNMASIKSLELKIASSRKILYGRYKKSQ